MLPAKWPKWSIIVIALALGAFAIGLVLLLEPLAQAVSPQLMPTPTLYHIQYAKQVSGGCEDCHFNQSALLASAEMHANVEAVWIEAESLATPHGSLGCITCHGGTGDVADREEAHQGLIEDLSETHPQDCLLCHRNLPAELPDDHLRTPHGRVVNAAWEGSACGVKCSDCHGQVGHGFDPVSGEMICPMNVCLDCHRERNLGTQLEDCLACHVGLHDVAAALTCSTCHISTDTWNETALQVHPVELTGRHATADCFSCHRWPNFKGLDYVCSDCHESEHPVVLEGSHAVLDCTDCHTDGQSLTYECADCHRPLREPHFGEACEDCHTPIDFKGATIPPELHPVPLVGAHESATCDTCHIEGQPEPEYVCSNCHQPPEDHLEGACDTCHTPEGWIESAGSTIVAQSPQISHGLDRFEDCLICHDPAGEVKPAPDDHAGLANEQCVLCHKAAP
jgi:hypothetical protein